MKLFALGYASTGVGVALGIGLTGVWFIARTTIARWTSVVAGFISPRKRPSRFKAIRIAELEWHRNQMHQAETTFFMKPLFHDTTSNLMMVRYPAGVVNPDHHHPIGHGMYVLQGELVTHRGTFGRDTFVWFPDNEVMWHGAGPHEDLIVLFVTGSNLRTRYVTKAR